MPAWYWRSAWASTPFRPDRRPAAFLDSQTPAPLIPRGGAVVAARLEGSIPVADPTAELIDRLLASGKVSSDTRDDLRGYKDDLAKGRLEAGDRRDVDALAARLLGVSSGGDDTGDGESAGDENAAPLDDEDLWDVGEDAEIAELRARAEAAEARVQELEAEVARLKQQLGQA